MASQVEIQDIQLAYCWEDKDNQITSMRIPKCTKTISGKHKFVDQSYYISWTNGRGPLKERVERPVERPIECEYCHLVDDRQRNKK